MHAAGVQHARAAREPPPPRDPVARVVTSRVIISVIVPSPKLRVFLRYFRDFRGTREVNMSGRPGSFVVADRRLIISKTATNLAGVPPLIFP